MINCRIEKPWENGKLIVSQNGRYLQHENGEPFFWLGDTAWLLFSRLNRFEVEAYLEHRREHGYNVIQIMIINSLPEKNIYGSEAFIDNNLTKPNIDYSIKSDPYNYWRNMDFVIEKAAEKGLYTALVPVWGSLVKNDFLSEDQASIYGKWLAERYKDTSNIIWINGGDVRGDEKQEVWKALGKAIKKYDPNHLMTFHPFGRTQSSMWFHNEKWLDFNMFQSGHRRYDQRDCEGDWKGEDNWKYVLEDYSREPAKPTLDGEPSYEGIPQGLHAPEEPLWKANDSRRYAYWSVFAGACGHSYGHGVVMQMHKPSFGRIGEYGVTEYWYDAVDSAGALQMKYLKNLILSRPYFERVNDQSIIDGDEGIQYNRVIAARGKNYLFVYTYTGRSFKVKLDKIAGEAAAWWYSPKDGNTIFIGNFENCATQEFNPPGLEREGNDWVLVIDNSVCNFPQPGSVNLSS